MLASFYGENTLESRLVYKRWESLPVGPPRKHLDPTAWKSQCMVVIDNVPMKADLVSNFVTFRH